MNMKELPFGTSLYYVDRVNMALRNKKIKTVIDGVEWFRYERENIKYSILEYIYVGKMEVVTLGEVDHDEQDDDKFFLREKVSGDLIYICEYDLENPYHWFFTREAAENYIKEERMMSES